MFDKDGKLDERSRRILSEQTIPPRYGRSPGMDAPECEINLLKGIELRPLLLKAGIVLSIDMPKDD